MAQARYFSDPDAEDQMWAQLEAARKRRAAYARSATPELATRTAATRTAYPHMRAGAVAALSSAGYGPDSALAFRAAQLSARVNIKRKKKRSVLDAMGTGLGSAIKAVGGGVSRVAKPVIRGGLTALESPLQEATGLFRAAVSGEAPRFSSTLALTARKWGEGEEVDLGSGFFPQGEVATEQTEVARSFGTIDGRAITPGRWLASKVVEPGTMPYKIVSGLTDAAVAIGADPATLALGGASKVSKSRKLFVPGTNVVERANLFPKTRKLAQAAGLIEGPRRTVLRDVAENWLMGEGSKVVDTLAKEADAAKIWRLTNKKIDLATAKELADAPDTKAVRDILLPKLGTVIREKPTVGGAGVTVRRRLEGVRLAQQMPGHHVDLDDLDDVAENMERFMRNARLAPERVDFHVNEIASAGDRIARYKAVSNVLEETAKHIGADDQTTRRLTQMFGDYHEELARYFVDEVGNNAPVLGAVVNGSGVALPSPHLFNEYINRALPLPDARAIRRATSRLGKLVDNEGFDLGVAALDWITSEVWKPLALLRGAWTVRVVGEEQVRMGASGFDSMFHHPLSAIAWVTGRKGALDVTGEAFDAGDELAAFGRAMSRNGGGWRDRRMVYGKKVVRRNDEDFTRSWAAELDQLHADPVAKRVAGGWGKDKVPGGLTGNHVDDAKRWFWEGPGQNFRKQLASAKGRENLLTDRAVADSYIDSIARRIEIKTGNDHDLLEAVRTGKLGEARLRDADAHTSLKVIADEGVGPEVVKGDIVFNPRTTNGSKLGGQLDKAVEYAFNGLMSRPTNFLSRSTTFKQSYWQRIEELMPHLSKKAQQAVESAAKEAGIGGSQFKRLARASSRGFGELGLDDADVIAKGFALDTTKQLLYDLSERGQFFDVARVVFPFGEAWKEVLTRWSKIAVENPKSVRRLHQIIQGARGEDAWFAVEGQDGKGFFYTDPTTGEEMFAYPGLSNISEQLFGAAVGGRVAGLNLFSGTVIPGVGPVVQIPAGALLPDKPEWDEVRDVLLPFGEIETEGGVVETFLPAWMQKLRQAKLTPFGQQDERVWNNTVMDVLRHMSDTGEADLSTDEGVQAALAEAKKKARGLYAFRGVVQFFAPSAPSPRFLAEDKDGRLTTASKLIEEFHKMEKEDPDSAVLRFLQTFGDDAFLYMQPKSQGQFAATHEAMNFQRAHPELGELFPNTYAFFAPKGTDFDLNAYMRQIASGERKALTPKEAIELANARVARMIYDAQRKRIDGTPDKGQQEWLDELRETLKEDYPGYMRDGFTIGKVDAVVDELQRAIKNPIVAKTPAGEALAVYLQARDKANDAAQALGVKSFKDAKDARHLRDWLRGIAESLVSETPEFQDVWDRVLSREMKRDEEETAP